MSEFDREQRATWRPSRRQVLAVLCVGTTIGVVLSKAGPEAQPEHLTTEDADTDPNGYGTGRFGAAGFGE